MKRLILLNILLLLVIGGASGVTTSPKKHGVAKTSSEKIEVYYFHFTRRCITCNAVEAESLKALQSLYPELLKTGKLSFKSINLDNADSKVLSEKCGAEGQSLLIVQGKKRTDLTSQGFMYARSNPARLKAEIKKTIDLLIR